jgi:hypothetical protein
MKPSPIDTTAEALPAAPPEPAPKHSPGYVKGGTQATINALRAEVAQLRAELADTRERTARVIDHKDGRIRLLEGRLRDCVTAALKAHDTLEGTVTA